MTVGIGFLIFGSFEVGALMLVVGQLRIIIANQLKLMKRGR